MPSLFFTTQKDVICLRRHNDYLWFWVPIIAPFIGAVVGAWIYQFVIGIHIPAEEQYEIVTTTVTTTQQQRELQPLAPAKELVGFL